MNSECWNINGMWGDRSCQELITYIHCRNCPTYRMAGRTLLDRPTPEDYQIQGTSLLSDNEDQQATDSLSVGIFRLQREGLALSAHLFAEIAQPLPIHTLPHRRSKFLLGLVNIRGEIQPCISLTNLLELETATSESIKSSVIYKRMVVVERQKQRWVFPVDEIYGIHRIFPTDLEKVPTTVSIATQTYTKAIIHWQGKRISYLDDQQLFDSLEQKVL